MLLKESGKIKKIKFLKTENQNPSLNPELIERTKLLLGVKRYYTNLSEQEVDNQTIIAPYHDLRKIKQAFRIPKNDLKTRPIFRYKEEPIKLHLLHGLGDLQIDRVVHRRRGKEIYNEAEKVTDARLLNKITK